MPAETTDAPVDWQRRAEPESLLAGAHALLDRFLARAGDGADAGPR
ncbi:MAG: hypothetical protein U5K43_03975 [Halofilum sp. (in: g-proteobacteria)]|nr:hypothetical protein [Halofilum sp. (in: g-proteobacteria)]